MSLARFKKIYTLSKISNWPPYIFTLVLKVRFGYANFILLLINQGFIETLHVIKFKNDWYFFTDDARVNVPLFQKVIYFLQYEIFHREAIYLNVRLFEDVSDC